jgi:hypothetical protein
LLFFFFAKIYFLYMKFYNKEKVKIGQRGCDKKWT